MYICGQKIPCPSLLRCDEFWGSQFSLKLVYFPSKNHHPIWLGLGRSSAVGRNSWAGEGSGLMPHCVCGLGARWDVGSPKIARSCGALSKRCDFPSCAWPRAGCLPQDLLLKLAVLPHTVCPAYVISSCLRRWRDQNNGLKKPSRFREVPFKLLFYGKSREKTFFLKCGRERTLHSFLCDAAVKLLMNINYIRHLQRVARKFQR